MHEASLAQSLVELIESHAKSHAAQRVARVVVEIGSLSDVEPGALRFGFDVAAHGTVADGAALDIETPGGTAWCFDCAETVALARRGDGCPECGGHRLVVKAGDGMRLKAIEIL
jgi:hydrogenase nickel incorporation protein HypA/HybF